MKGKEMKLFLKLIFGIFFALQLNAMQREKSEITPETRQKLQKIAAQFRQGHPNRFYIPFENLDAIINSDITLTIFNNTQKSYIVEGALLNPNQSTIIKIPFISSTFMSDIEEIDPPLNLSFTRGILIVSPENRQIQLAGISLIFHYASTHQNILMIRISFFVGDNEIGRHIIYADLSQGPFHPKVTIIFQGENLEYTRLKETIEKG
jgi:hypothetical protein